MPGRFVFAGFHYYCRMNTPADPQLEYLRVPPHSIEAEQSVLGGLLLDNAAWERVSDTLREEDFYRYDHRLIWHHIARLIELSRPADVITVHDNRRRRRFHRTPAFAFEESSQSAGNRIVAPMPGRIVVVKAKPGDDVAEGAELLVMEAMKMELSLKAPRAGKVEAVQAAAGDFVEADAVLVRLADA